ncbi:Uncharacterised protein [uncultured archaeon]|nr:Uncharacterised protein [uncultured archaeon]
MSKFAGMDYADMLASILKAAEARLNLQSPEDKKEEQAIPVEQTRE